jgi:hypothetical protein
MSSKKKIRKLENEISELKLLIKDLQNQQQIHNMALMIPPPAPPSNPFGGMGLPISKEMLAGMGLPPGPGKSGKGDEKEAKQIGFN